MPLPTHCIYETDNPRSIYDHAPDLESAKIYAWRMTKKTGKAFSADTLDGYMNVHRNYWLAAGPLHEITETEYIEALEVLPPIYRAGAMHGFFMCEFTSGSITSQYVQHDGRYYSAYVDILHRETWITPERIAALSWPEWTVTGEDRQQGAIGISEPFTVTVRAADRDGAWQAAHKVQQELGRADNFLATGIEQKGA